MAGKPGSPTLERPSEISELIDAIMQERGGVPHHDKQETPETDEIRMAEAP